jgi:predicted PurR-regulated permease PerM
MAVPSRKIEISSSTIYRTLLIGVAFWLLYIVRDVLLVIFAAVVISAAMEPLAKRLQKYHIPRGVTVAVLYLLILAVLGLSISLVIPPLTDQLKQIAQTVPTVVAQIEHYLGISTPQGSDAVVQQIQAVLSQAGDNIATLGVSVVQQTRNILTAIVSLVLVFIIAFYLTIEDHALNKAFRLVVPRQYMTYVDYMIERVQGKIGRWMLGQLAMMAVMGLIMGLGLWALGVQYALSLGLLAAILEVMPVIGPIITAVPAFLIALAQSPLTAVTVIVFYVIAHQLENHVLVPNIMGKAIGLNPLVTLLAVLLGARLLGIPGIILAVPFAAIVSVFAADFFAASDETDELPG